MSATDIVVAGPYELQHKTKKDEKMTLAITDDNSLQWRTYKGLKIMNRDQIQCKDFEDAMTALENKLQEVKSKQFFTKEDL